MCWLVLPLAFYLKVFRRDQSIYERVVMDVVGGVCTVVSCFVSRRTGRRGARIGTVQTRVVYKLTSRTSSDTMGKVLHA